MFFRLLVQSFLVLLVTQAMLAANVDNNQSQRAPTPQELEARQVAIKQINSDMDAIDAQLTHNVMHAKYNNHQTYLNIEKEINALRTVIKKNKRLHDSKNTSELTVKYKSLENQLDLLGDFQEEPFLTLTKPNDIPDEPKISSPFDIINGFSYVKQLKNDKSSYSKKLKTLLELIDLLEVKERHIHDLQNIFGPKYQHTEMKNVQKELDYVMNTFDLATTTNDLYQQKLDDTITRITTGIKEQVKKLFKIAIMILLILLFSFILKYFAKKTIKDNERYYMANKGINFSNLVLIGLVLLFSFLENATYLVTVLGFASAGIAIAMKDIFMSSLGWLVIVFGGSFHVGDRVKVYKGNHSYVGDIVDISFLRMTILEDITLTTYMENRRSGRIIFIPNNYIFTELIANYTHGKIKTVWDGIDIMITFDSNHKKATHIIKEIVKKYSKGYTDISRKQLNSLRNQYSLKNINVEPRIYTFIEKSGICVSCWYMTNSYAALTLRSNISANIMDEINAEDDIKIAYNTQVINIKRDEKLMPAIKDEDETESLS